MGEKFRYFLAAGLAVWMLGISEPALAKETYPSELLPEAKQLAPISNWNVDYGEEHCRLTRIFGSKEDRHLLSIEQFAPDQQFTLFVAGSQLSDWRRLPELSIGMVSGAPVKRVEMFSNGSLSDYGNLVTFSTRLEETALGERTARQMGVDTALAGRVERTILRSKHGAVSFETGEMGPVFEALNSCTRDLLIGWGLDPDAHMSYVPVNLRDPSKIFDKIFSALPSKKRRNIQEQSFKWRIIVEQDGSVSTCHSLRASGDAQVQMIGCERLQRMRFIPARSASGEAMRSYSIIALSTGPTVSY